MLEGLSALKAKGFTFYHLHSGNVIIDDGNIHECVNERGHGRIEHDGGEHHTVHDAACHAACEHYREHAVGNNAIGGCIDERGHG